MKPGENLVIMRCANGFIVRPDVDNPKSHLHEMIVFQDLGDALSDHGGRQTLLEYIKTHMTEKSPS